MILSLPKQEPPERGPEPTDLNQKAWKGEWVLPQHHSSPIPDQLAHTAPEDGEQESPGLIFDPEGDMDEHCKEEEQDEYDVGGEFGAVLVDAYAWGTVLRARCQGAVLVWTIAYEVIGVMVGVCHCGLLVFLLLSFLFRFCRILFAKE